LISQSLTPRAHAQTVAVFAKFAVGSFAVLFWMGQFGAPLRIKLRTPI
jgi:hypothetical protein